MLKSFFSLFKLFKLYLLARFKKTWDMIVLDCEDVTSEFDLDIDNERMFRVRYAKIFPKKNPIIYIRYIKYNGKYSENPEIALLQKHCVERG
jgi:hypothetical protein